MIIAYRMISQYHQLNATHRKGFKLQDMTDENILAHAQEELDELKDMPNNPLELADIFGCLLHYAYVKGWTLPALEQMLLSKLKERCTLPDQ